MIAEIEIGLPETIFLASTREEAGGLVVEGIPPGRVLLVADMRAMREQGMSVADARALMEAKIVMNSPRIQTRPDPPPPQLPVVVELTPEEMSLARSNAVLKDKNKKRNRTPSKLTGPGTDLDKTEKANRGEIASARILGAKFDERILDGGDGGVDYTLPDGRTVDAKTIQAGGHYFKLTKPDPMSFTADLGVLVVETEAPNTLVVTRYATREKIRAAPSISLGGHKPSPALHDSDMIPIADLIDELKRGGLIP